MTEMERKFRIKEVRKSIFKERNAEEYYALMGRVTHRAEFAALYSNMADRRYGRQKSLRRELVRLQAMVPMVA